MPKLFFLALLAVAIVPAAAAQDPPARVRAVCDPSDSAHHCPGPDCRCIPDRLEIVLEGTDDSVLVLKDSAPGQRIRLAVTIDVKSPDTPGNHDIHGWSYGVLHDDTVLTILSATTEGADWWDVKPMAPFDATYIDVRTCAAAQESCPDPRPGGGFLSAVVIVFGEGSELPAGRRVSLAFAEYETTGKPFQQTLIQFTDRIASRGSPPVAINITVRGNSRRPEEVVDGLILGPGGRFEDCGNARDDDGDGQADCADEDCCGDPACPPCGCDRHAYYFGPAATRTDLDLGAGTDFVISMRNAEKSTGFYLAARKFLEGEKTRWQFSDRADDFRRAAITDEQGMSHSPVAANQLFVSQAAMIGDITRGAAIAGFADRDFLAADSGQRPTGFFLTVEYAADTNPPPGQAGNLIPATAEGPPCPVNEILRVKLSPPPGPLFHRGDVDADGRLSVVDAVLGLHARVGGRPPPIDCTDALDVNDDGAWDLADAIYLLNYLFLRGPALPAPFRACAADPTADGLNCAASNCRA
jgi:hypothetical protein